MNATVKKRKKIKKEEVVGVVLAAGPLLGFFIFGFIPMVLAVFMSFMKIRGFSFDGARLVGFENYRYVFTDPKFGKAMLNTLYAAVSMPVSIVCSLFIATLLNKKVAGTKVFRTILFLPYVCSVVAITTMWKWMLNTDFGIINEILKRLGVEKVPWLTDSTYFMPSMLIMGVWGGTGFGIILYSAALGNVSKSLYEAAKIDGANRRQQFFSITVPSISPTTFYLFVMGLIGALQDFVRFQIMGGDGGGPGESGLTAVFYLWRMGFKNFIVQGMGMASAVSLILAALIIIITIINFKVSKYWVHND
ncbi:MAG: sugar ABC transporter permease [Clostridiales bacterium]|jgi:multiple sugar transport system permease protein|nr:sugar ABC transporter permease [Clostridiales bacterium]